MSVTVDGNPTPAHGTVLDACRAVGADVPALCRDERVEAGGHCRACLVDVDGRLVAACTTPARAGQVVRTDTPALREYRRDLGELMASEATAGGRVGRLLAAWGVRGDRYGAHVPTAQVDATHPQIRVALDACVRCWRCVDVCEQVEGRAVFAMLGRGAGTHLGWSGGAFATSGCSACGACSAVCPSGALSDVDRLWPASPTSVQTTCGNCGVGCQLRVWTDGRVVQRIDGVEGAPNRGHLCARGRFAHGYVRRRERLTRPLVRVGTELVPVSWERALVAAARGLHACAGRVAGIASPRCTNEEAYLLQKWVRGTFGSNDVDVTGRGAADASRRLGACYGDLGDLDGAELIAVVGVDPSTVGPVVGARVTAATLRGAGLVVIDARATALADLADVHLRARPGTEGEVLSALDAAVRDAPRAAVSDAVATRLGIEPSALSGAATRLATSRRVVWIVGEDHVAHDVIEAIGRLVDAGGPGVRVIPVTAAANVRGVLDVGCRPDALPGGGAVGDAAARAAVEAEWGRPIPAIVGRSSSAILEAVRTDEVRGLFLLGVDPLGGARPWADAATLDRAAFVVVQDVTLTEAARRAHVVLPGASFLEKDGTFTACDGHVQRVRRVVDPVDGARADVRVLLGLMAASGWPQSATDPDAVFDEIARVVPWLAEYGCDPLEGGEAPGGAA